MTMRTMLGSGALALSAAMLAAATAPQANPVKDGVDAWGRGDYKAAVQDWRGPAAKGDADAEFNMGQAYKLGRGVPADLNQAEQWFGKAAAQGHFQAEDDYGLLLYQSGKRDQAAPWLEKSVKRGEPRAELVLGTMLFNGDGVTKDWVRAYALMTRASSQGLPQAAQTLADMNKYVSDDQKQQGLALARQYETEAQKPQLPAELAGGSTSPIRTTPLPPSHAAGGPGASYPAPGSKASPPPAVAKAKPAPHIQPTPAKPAATGGWRVQLGAFSAEGHAKALWQKLSPRVAGLKGAQPYLVHAGSLTKLQAGPFGSGAEAARACAEVKRAGNGCLTIGP